MKATPPPRLFAAVSFLMIMAMVVGTGWVQAPFFRQSIIDREAAIVQDLVEALTVEQALTAADMQHGTDGQARQRFEQIFKTLTLLPGTARIKVFNRENTVIWSDDPDLVGTRQTDNPDRLALAMQGVVQAVFNPVSDRFEASQQGQGSQGTIECYVPIFSQTTPQTGPQAQTQVIGVLSLYRNPHALNQTIQHGLVLLWAVIGGGGLILFLVLYKVFSVAYRRQQVAESELGKLTSEHERIVQLAKMSAMGELVGEIAHQLNNPLVGVINLSQLAEREVHDPQRVAELLAEVRKAGTECRDIVQRILRINQTSRSTLAPTHLIALVQDTITFCHQSIDLKHAVDFVAPQQEVKLHVDAVLVRQALFNLIHNAVLSAPDAPVQVALTLTPRANVAGVQISVTDSGPGFSAETAAKLFKPFFTTRAHGTGLGLSVAQHIAMKHGGVVLAENLAQGGARFSLWLPLESTP
ncbi:HAMP domain-containing histidine kinase [Rhodoferax sp. U2-2l]|uniref:sensor histidine kinase n=1 Tax=Rhodoferax sp. U2-2l TaxID=2884000 RepID=UPI001D0BB7B3|nr:HAMP domain-containing sensor histidine kinase [Rhodoferax sp. U2-2l]MCB8747458.1 HAMP domain-containing histidine kinase [Rhodoferax sp. U2-2l]